MFESIKHYLCFPKLFIIMKVIRRASATWKGTGKEGSGTVSTQSTVLNNTQFSFGSRFEEGVGTNPEELIGAAHAGCFSMKLSFIIVAAGFTADSINTNAKVTLEDGKISTIHLDVKAKVPGMNADQFAAAANDAKANCPISKSLNAEITMDAVLEA
jgi:osmotically inducible protein OsmC